MKSLGAIKSDEDRRAIPLTLSSLTLRDYFAALASDADIERIRQDHPSRLSRAEARFLHADAMLAHRAER